MTNEDHVADASKTIDHIREVTKKVEQDHVADDGKKVELLPCPFCGGEAEVIYTEWCAMFTVRCADEYHNCEVMPETRHFVVEREAIEAWNRRSDGNG